MPSFLIVFVRFLKAFRQGLTEPEFRAVAVLLLFLLVSGTVFYTLVEGWRPLDSLFFSVVTLATVGYGNQVPVTDLGKIFTIVYIFVGIGVLVLFAQILAKHLLQQKGLVARRPRRNK